MSARSLPGFVENSLANWACKPIIRIIYEINHAFKKDRSPSQTGCKLIIIVFWDSPFSASSDARHGGTFGSMTVTNCQLRKCCFKVLPFLSVCPILVAIQF